MKTVITFLKLLKYKILNQIFKIFKIVIENKFRI